MNFWNTWRKTIQAKYCDVPLSKGFTYLYAGKTIVMVASAMLGLFLPIFLYNLFNQDLQKVLYFYGAGFLSYGIVVVFGARFLNRYGFRRALQTSVIMGMAYYTIFYFLDQSNAFYLIPLSVFVLVLFRLTYWVPYHVDFTKFTSRKTRGRQVSIIWATRALLGIFIPIFSGFVISRFGFDVLFLIAILLYFTSGIPYLSIPRTREKYRWKWKRTWKEFLNKKRRKINLAHAALGAENLISLVVWPIFIFQVLEGSYFQVGAVSTLIIAVSVVIQLMLGKYMDLKANKEKIMKWGTYFYAFGWIIKIFITTAFQIFLIGAYHNISSIFVKTPFNALTYEIAADQEHYVDEYTVLREMSIQFGRVLTILLIFFLSLFLSLQWIFIIAATAALFFNLLKKKDLLAFPK